ncbi:MAG: quinone oxidoreductase family protein [Phycisphaeraceae bacterium]
MRAMVMTDFGGPDVLKMQDMPEPTLGEQDVLVEVHATAVNPVDTKIREGGMGQNQPPMILGYDVSGIVREVGSMVSAFRVGEEVYASPDLTRPGADAELVAVDARTIAHKSSRLSHLESAALPLVTITAWQALHHRARLHQDETVLIHGGAGGVAHIGLQLAKLHGCRVITTASTDESRQLCEQYGADVIIDYQNEDVVKRVNAETDGRRCDVVFDTVGGEVFNLSLDCVGVHGRLVTILPPPENAPIQKLFLKDATIALEFMGAATMFGTCPQRQGEILQTVAELVDAEKLKPHVSHTFPLEQLPDAHRQQETGHTHGKIAVTVKE